MLFAWSSDTFVLLACVGGAIAVGAWWMLVVRRLGRDGAAQRAAAQAALARVRSGAVAGAMLATVVLCGFLVTGLAWNPSSAQMLAWLRAAGVPDIDESDIVRALYRDEYLWRDQAVDRSRPPAERTSPLDWWTRPEIDRYSSAGFGSQRAWLDREETVGTGLLVASRAAPRPSSSRRRARPRTLWEFAAATGFCSSGRTGPTPRRRRASGGASRRSTIRWRSPSLPGTGPSGPSSSKRRRSTSGG